MSEGTVTHEFFAGGFDTGYPAPGIIHAREVIAAHLDPLPLCWVADGNQRGATVEEWEVSFDHETLPAYGLIDSPAFVTCADCKEWMHA